MKLYQRDQVAIDEESASGSNTPVELRYSGTACALQAPALQV